VTLPYPPMLSGARDAAPEIDLTPPTLDLVDVIDADGRVAWSNEAEASALGYADGALAGMAIDVLYERAAVDWIRAVAGHPAPSGASTAELVMLRRDGSRLRTLGRVLAPPSRPTIGC